MNAGWGLIRELSDHRVHTESSVVMTSPNIFVSSDVFRSFQYLEQSVLQAILCTGLESATTRIFSLHKSVIILGNELSIKICTAQRKYFYIIPCQLKNVYSEIVALCCFCVFCRQNYVTADLSILTLCRLLFFPMPIDNNSWWVGLDNSSSGSKQMPPGVPSYPAPAARSVVGWGWSHHHQATWSCPLSLVLASMSIWFVTGMVYFKVWKSDRWLSSNIKWKVSWASLVRW